jgi:hypothetical protein
MGVDVAACVFANGVLDDAVLIFPVQSCHSGHGAHV